MGRKMIDLTEQNINGIIVHSPVEEQGGAGKHKRWYCTCPICNEIFIASSQHLRDKNKSISMCSNCSRKNFKDLTGKKFGRLLVLSKDNNNKSKRIRFLCRCDCGNIISVQANHLVDGSIKNCINCKITSKGEEKIKIILDELNIKYEREKIFDDCKYRTNLRFDFYIPEFNCVIEFQGIQHYKPIDFFGGEKIFNEQKIKDKIKKDFCKNNNIKFLEVSYNDNIRKKIYNILLNEDIV